MDDAWVEVNGVGLEVQIGLRWDRMHTHGFHAHMHCVPARLVGAANVVCTAHGDHDTAK